MSNTQFTSINNNLLHCIQTIREPLHILKLLNQQDLYLFPDSQYNALSNKQDFSHVGLLPTIYPEWLGSIDFINTHHIRYPYIVGEMANGIATAKMVIEAARAGFLGFFGAAGLMPDVIEKNLLEIFNQLGHEMSWGSNLIHSPQEPKLEELAVDLYLKYGVKKVSASAYMSITPALVRYAAKGLHVDQQGNIHRLNYVIAKLSRPEVAKLFMSPPPANILDALVQSKQITSEEAKLATFLPLAEDITVEADSGGHTDNRPLTALFPTILLLSQEITNKNGYQIPIRVGAAGGLGTPSALVAAFNMGAAYVLTGSINQSAVEAGLSQEGKKLLAEVGIADMMMTAAADMFELGVKLQVMKRGTLFGARANKLYDIYSRYNSIEEIPTIEKTKIEEQIFRANLNNIWELTEQFFEQRDSEQIIKAQQNPKHKMALIFRWYLGLSSRWAIQGDTDRKADYQIWCGPAMGSFNQWAANSFLENLSNRTVKQIGLNLLEGAATLFRAQQLREFGLSIPIDAFNFRPRELL